MSSWRPAMKKCDRVAEMSTITMNWYSCMNDWRTKVQSSNIKMNEAQSSFSLLFFSNKANWRSKISIPRLQLGNLNERSVCKAYDISWQGDDLFCSSSIVEDFDGVEYCSAIILRIRNFLFLDAWLTHESNYYWLFQPALVPEFLRRKEFELLHGIDRIEKRMHLHYSWNRFN